MESSVSGSKNMSWMYKQIMTEWPSPKQWQALKPSVEEVQ